MFSPDIPNFFLIVLSGFGVVWGFRQATGSKDILGDFEYLAYSTVWGIPIGIIFLVLIKDYQLWIKTMDIVPMVGTVFLFPIGVTIGFGAGMFARRFGTRIWKNLNKPF